MNAYQVITDQENNKYNSLTHDETNYDSYYNNVNQTSLGQSLDDTRINAKNSDKNNKEVFSYQINITSEGVCKICDKAREKFLSNNMFHKHI